jgi:hypothetical protein
MLNLHPLKNNFEILVHVPLLFISSTHIYLYHYSVMMYESHRTAESNYQDISQIPLCKSLGFCQHAPPSSTKYPNCDNLLFTTFLLKNATYINQLLNYEHIYSLFYSPLNCLPLFRCITHPQSLLLFRNPLNLINFDRLCLLTRLALSRHRQSLVCYAHKSFLWQVYYLILYGCEE